jgi:ATP synthase protein I
MTDQDPSSLSKRIAAAKAEHTSQRKTAKAAEQVPGVSAGAMALRYGAEFGTSVFVGILLGLMIDKFAGTRPWGLLIMMGFGLAAGVLGVIRAYQELTDAANPANSGPETGEKPRE